MDCGIRFCHNGCPLGQPHHRVERTSSTRRRLGGRGRPAPRDQQLPPSSHRAAVARALRDGLRARPSTQTPVTIKQVEVEIIDRAWADGGVVPVIPEKRSPGSRSPVVGSGTVRSRRRPAADCGAGQPGGPSSSADDAVGGLAPLRHPRGQDGKKKRHPGPAGSRRCEGGRHRFVTRPAGRVGGAARGDSPRSSSPAARGVARDLPVAGPATWPASTRRWSSCPSPTGTGRARRSTRRASTSSSSAAATPARTASGPRTARAPRR